MKKKKKKEYSKDNEGNVGHLRDSAALIQFVRELCLFTFLVFQLFLKAVESLLICMSTGGYIANILNSPGTKSQSCPYHPSPAVPLREILRGSFPY